LPRLTEAERAASRVVRGRAGERIQPFRTPGRSDEYGDAKPWPKFRAEEMLKLGLDYRPYRAWYRQEVRDQVRSTFTVTEYAMVQVRDENRLLKNQISGYDVRLMEIDKQIADQQQIIVDLHEAMQAELDLVRSQQFPGPYRAGQRGLRPYTTARTH
jgi:hypothetical protein